MSYKPEDIIKHLNNGGKVISVTSKNSWQKIGDTVFITTEIRAFNTHYLVEEIAPNLANMLDLKLDYTQIFQKELDNILK
jgi:hypothetical protein